MGKSEPIGDADFYPNGIVPLMPGCLTIFCSHSRAWEYFAETVIHGNENNFMAKKCGSLHSFDIDACVKQTVPMGYACPKNIKGNFFLRTNDKSPFGKYEKSDESENNTKNKETSTSSLKQSEATTSKSDKGSETPSTTPQSTKKFLIF